MIIKNKKISKTSEIKNIVITNGNDDIFYTNGELSIFKNVQQSSNIINDTGAGDVFQHQYFIIGLKTMKLIIT